ncbi:hypothetical protein NSER024013_17560 [Nocardia seriolae]|nr:hypothetical protein NSER024013_17560 [Nocardia seriolae]
MELSRDLSEAEKSFVLDHWQPNPEAQCRESALFTPSPLAREFVLHVNGFRVIDLGAGIGALAFACHRSLMFDHRFHAAPPPEIVCVEQSPEFVRIGLKVLPEAVWICQDLLRLPRMWLRTFHAAVSHPPHGVVPRSADAPGYRGHRFEYHTIAVAAQLADHGAFLIPQRSAPFTRSGHTDAQAGDGDAEYTRFHAGTGITLRPSGEIDTSYYHRQWRHRPPDAELVLADFTEPTVLRAARRASDCTRPVRQ